MSGWVFDIDILCPFCGGHRIKYSAPSCPKFGQLLNEKYFVILKFMELEYKIKELEKLNEKEKTKELSDSEIDNISSERVKD